MDEVITNNDSDSVLDISFYQLVDVLPDAAFVCNQGGHIIACSYETLRFFNINDKAKVIGSSLQSFIAYENIDESFFLLSAAVNEANSLRSAELLVKKGAKETCSANVTFSSVSGSNSALKYVLITFRETQEADTVIDSLHKKDSRLARLCETVINNEGKSDERTQKLLSQLGETLGAISCTYFSFEKNELHPVTSWESPFNTAISPLLGSKQLVDYLIDHEENYSLIKNPLLTAFLESEPTYRDDFGVKALLGYFVGKNTNSQGLLTAIFTVNYSLSEVDTKFIQAISSMLSFDNSDEKLVAPTAEFSFRHFIDCFTDPVYILSAEGLIMEVNKSATKFYGYEREEFIGQSPLIFSVEEKNDDEHFKSLFAKALSGEPQKFEWTIRRKDGETTQKEITFNKSQYYDHDVVVAIGRDLGESKKVEQELLRYNEELKESNMSKDKFFSILAHDLKNPFQGLLGFIDLLYEDLDELSNAQIKEYLSNVRNASYHTYALLENLLEWSRIQSGKMPFTPAIFNIKDEIDSVISVLDSNARSKNIKLINEVDDDIEVEADRNMIHSVIQNLVTNSIKFSNSKGRVVIRCRVPLNYVRRYDNSDPGERQWLEISISDNGIGIPEEILPKLFKLNGQYSQAGTANEPGTGLGLVLCHEMVEKNGGRIWAESIAGQGTTFIFTVPLSF